VTVLLVVALLVGYFHFRARPSSALTEQDTLVLADFNNTTGETVFDGTLKQALRVQLEQSPFLNVLLRSKSTRQELSYMGRPLDTKLMATWCGKYVCGLEVRHSWADRFPLWVTTMWFCFRP
jgi:hypothetical protein